MSFNIRILSSSIIKAFGSALCATPSPLGRAGVGLLGRAGVGLSVCLFLCGCITEYEAKGLDDIADILVVEGIITDDETTITLVRSINMSSATSSAPVFNFVNDAVVSVECDDGTAFTAELSNSRFDGRYTIQTGILDLNRKYRLKIEMDERDVEFHSEFTYPIQTPEIDSVFWTKKGTGQPVNIHVTTQSPENKIQYYRWSYREDWEVVSDFFIEYSDMCRFCAAFCNGAEICPKCGLKKERYPSYCWGTANNKTILLGAAEKNVFGRVIDLLTEINPSDDKLMKLYRIDVRQNTISKQAHDYFTNIRKNSQLTGSIFASTPSELRGNILCYTEPGRPVIGYIDVSSTTHKRLYIPGSANVYERPVSKCGIYTEEEWCPDLKGCLWPPNGWIYWDDEQCVDQFCVDCTYGRNTTTNKPDDWPNDH